LIKLRPVEPADVEAFFEHQSDPVAAAMAAFPARDREAHSAHWKRITTDPGVVIRTIVVDRAVAGNVVSWTEGGRRLVGYWIGREDWGRGVASAALGAFVREIAERPIFAFVAELD
jgi:RimJ/RimL family protein N-acetyltransferase